jgi:arylsulfatase A-like enzyme
MTNFLVICIDCLRFDRFRAAVTGGRFLPDAIARQGVFVERCYTAAPWTYPSTNSLLTGLYPHRHGAWHEGAYRYRVSQPWPAPLKQGIPNLFSLLKPLGYRTAGISTIFWALTPGCDYPGCDRIIRSPGQEVFYQNTPADWVVDAFREVFRTRLCGGPFAAYLHLIDLHRPLDVQAGLAHAAEPVVPLPGLDDWDVRSIANRPEALEAFRVNRLRLYDGVLAYVGTALERLLAFLTTEGAAEETVVVIVADHGEEFWDHHAFQLAHYSCGRKSEETSFLGTGHGHTLFEELIHVPLMFLDPTAQLPKQAAGRLTSTVDILPTLLDLAGAEMPPELDGRSLLRGERDWVLAEGILYGWERKAVVTHRSKCIYAPGDRHVGFFDLAADPAEREPLMGIAQPSLLEIAEEYYRRGLCSERGQSLA